MALRTQSQTPHWDKGPDWYGFQGVSRDKSHASGYTRVCFSIWSFVSHSPWEGSKTHLARWDHGFLHLAPGLSKHHNFLALTQKRIPIKDGKWGESRFRRVMGKTLKISVSQSNEWRIREMKLARCFYFTAPGGGLFWVRFFFANSKYLKPSSRFEYS